MSPVEDALTQILQGNDFPAFAHQMREVMAALDHPESSTQRVVNVVLRDYGLTLKLIRAANSIHFNRTGRPVRSATHAMLLLGARTARSIASCLMLFDHYQGRSGLKELMLLSMLTASHAREVAARVAGAEPEEAHLAGMFRNLGEVLVAAHFPEEYARVLALVQSERRKVASAALSVLRYQFEDLGEAMARHWGMPDGVQRVIRAWAPSNTAILPTITAFSHDLTTAIYRRDPVDAGADSTSTAIAETVQRYGKRLGLSLEDVRNVVEAAVTETRDMFLGARVSFDDLRLRRQTCTALEILGGDRAPTAGDAGGPTVPGSTGALSGSAATGGHEAVMPIALLREELLNELDASVAVESGLALDKALLLALETLVRGGPFDRALFAVVNPERTEVLGRFGLGDGVDALVARFRYPLAPRGGPIGAAMTRRDELVMFDERAARPDEVRTLRALGARGAALVPLVLAGKLLGCLYVDRVGRGESPDLATLAFARRVRLSAARAIEQRRSHTPPSATAVQAATPPPASLPDSATGLAQGEPVAAVTHKADLVMRILRGEGLSEVSATSGIPVAVLDGWRTEFLAGAMAALGATGG